MERHRPKGISLIGILSIIAGIFFIIAGVAIFFVIPLLVNKPEMFQGKYSTMSYQLFTGPVGYAIASGITALGAADIIVGFGLLRGKQWAWKVAVILSLISIAGDIISLITQFKDSNPAGSVIGIIISCVILYYLYRPHVKSYFGKTPTPGTESFSKPGP